MNLLELTLQGGVLIGAILLLRLLGRYRLPGWTFRVLWGIALARLLIPVALPFPWNIYAGLEHLAGLGQAAQTATLDGVEYPYDTLIVGGEYVIDYDAGGHLVDFAPATKPQSQGTPGNGR